MRAIAIALVALALAGTEAAAQMVGGAYRVDGTNPDGSAYTGTATITPSSDTTCRISWRTGSTSTGICMTAGKALAASYVLNGKVGLVLYRLEADGSLRGVWTVADQPGAGSETLTPAK
jgi:hypothetical protein